MLIILLGYMGCGKSVVGQLLAEKLNYSFIDLDREIEKRTGQTIADLFKNEGEEYFRKIESETLNQLIKSNKTVMAVGGGTPCFNNNMELMNDNATAVYLKTPAGVLFSRLIKEPATRPLIKDLTSIQLMDYIIDTLIVREKFYNKAKWVIETEKLSIKKVTECIAERL